MRGVVVNTKNRHLYNLCGHLLAPDFALKTERVGQNDRSNGAEKSNGGSLRTVPNIRIGFSLSVWMASNYFGLMRWYCWFAPLVSRSFVMVSLALFLVGCATARIDWNSRIGNYTFDQAVLELGPPEKSATISDGTKVAEWLTTRGYARGTMTSFDGFGGYYHGYPWIHFYSEQPSPDHFIRLTFSKDGVLRTWKKVLR